MQPAVKHHSGHHHRAESRRRRKYPPGAALLQTHAWGQADGAGRVPPRSGRPRRQPREASERPGHRARHTPFRPSYWPSRLPGGHLSAGLIGVTADEHWVIRLGPTYALLLIGNGPSSAPSPLRGGELQATGYRGRQGAHGARLTRGESLRAALCIPAGADQARATSAASPGAAGALGDRSGHCHEAARIRTMPAARPGVAGSQTGQANPVWRGRPPCASKGGEPARAGSPRKPVRPGQPVQPSSGQARPAGHLDGPASLSG